MRIIIIGMGNTGSKFAEFVEKENHDVIVVDRNQAVVDEITDRYNVNGVCGSGASREILMKAGADTADLVACFMPVEEVNLLCCMVAKSCGARYTAACMESPEFMADEEKLKETFKVDYLFNPKLLTAREISQMILFPARIKTQELLETGIIMSEVPINSGEMLQGQKLAELRTKTDAHFLIATVQRGNKVLVPDGNFVLKEGDTAGILAKEEDTIKLMKQLSLAVRPVKKVCIAGCGTIGFYLAKELLKNHISVKILEKSPERCRTLYEELPEAGIICGSAMDAELFAEEKLETMDAFVAATGRDETNLLASLIADTCGIKTIITKVDTDAYEKVLRKADLSVAVSPGIIASSKMLGYVHERTDKKDGAQVLTGYFQFVRQMVEAALLEIGRDDGISGLALKDKHFRLKPNTIIAAVIRGRETFIPNGNTVLDEGDRVLVLTQKENRLTKIEDIFEKR